VPSCLASLVALERSSLAQTSELGEGKDSGRVDDSKRQSKRLKSSEEITCGGPVQGSSPTRLSGRSAGDRKKATSRTFTAALAIAVGTIITRLRRVCSSYNPTEIS
jgi:hypothetical protein